MYEVVKNIGSRRSKGVNKYYTPLHYIIPYLPAKFEAVVTEFQFLNWFKKNTENLLK